jgi:hypothetical protein
MVHACDIDFHYVSVCNDERVLRGSEIAVSGSTATQYLQESRNRWRVVSNPVDFLFTRTESGFLVPLDSNLN